MQGQIPGGCSHRYSLRAPEARGRYGGQALSPLASIGLESEPLTQQQQHRWLGKWFLGAGFDEVARRAALRPRAVPCKATPRVVPLPPSRAERPLQRTIDSNGRRTLAQLHAKHPAVGDQCARASKEQLQPAHSKQLSHSAQPFNLAPLWESCERLKRTALADCTEMGDFSPARAARSRHMLQELSPTSRTR